MQFSFIFLKNTLIPGQADFFTEKYRKFVDDRAYSIMANLIGQPAANLIMTDTQGKTRSLYEIPANFVVVCFWDPTCSHCKETIPKLDSIFQAKWKYEGVTGFAVMVDGGQDNWPNFIRDHNLGDWINVYQTTPSTMPKLQRGIRTTGSYMMFTRRRYFICWIKTNESWPRNLLISSWMKYQPQAEKG